ncbi:MAG: CHAT domain-containing protein [Flavobacteriales bacterium]|nr:CHAT domain-containing protein [Flavobacteriales bacterium]
MIYRLSFFIIALILSGFSSFAQADKDEQRLRDLMHDGQMEVAAEAADSLLARMPAWPPERYLRNVGAIGSVAVRVGDNERADSLFAQTFSRLATDFPEAQWNDKSTFIDSYAEFLWFTGSPVDARNMMRNVAPYLVNDTIGSDQAKFHNNMGIVEWNLGNASEALYHLKAALELNGKIHGEDSRRYGRNLNNIGVLYLEQGDLPLSREFFERSITIAASKSENDTPDMIYPCNNLGTICAEMGDAESSARWFDRSQSILETSRQPELRYIELQLLRGQAYLDLGDTAKAAITFREVLEGDMSQVNPVRQLETQWSAYLFDPPSVNGFEILKTIDGSFIAFDSTYANHPARLPLANEKIRLALNEGSELAEQLITQTLHRYELDGKLMPEVDLSETLLLASQLESKLEDRVPHYQRAIDLLLDCRSALIFEEASSTFYEDVRDSYHYMINDVYVELNGDISEEYQPMIFEWIEECKSFTHQWFLASYSDEDEQIRDDLSKIFYLRSQIENSGDGTGEMRAELIQRIQALPEDRRSQSQSLSKLQSSLNGQQRYISFLLINDVLWKMDVTANAFELQRITAIDLEDQVMAAYTSVSDRAYAIGSTQLREAWKTHYSNLGKLLDLENLNDRVYINADGPLHQINLSLCQLATEGKLSEIIRVQSAGHFEAITDQELKVEAMTKQFYTSKLSSLIGVEKELQLLQDLGLIKHSFQDSLCSMASLKKVAYSHRALHLAMHTQSERLSRGLVLTGNDGNDTIVTPQGLYELAFTTPHVTLSACETAFGEILPGESVQDLSTPFLRRGAQTVLAGLWKADDFASAEFMASYYQHLAEGATASNALIAASNLMRNGEDPLRAHPYFWANWQVYGGNIQFAQPKTEMEYVLSIAVLIALVFFGAWIIRKRFV